MTSVRLLRVFIITWSLCNNYRVFLHSELILISLKLILRTDSHSLITRSVALPSCSLFTTTTGKTTPTSASTTRHGAAFPKEAGDSERGTGPDRLPPVGEQGSPDSEPISVEMEGKGRGRLSPLNSAGDFTAGPRSPNSALLTRLTQIKLSK